MPAVSDKPKVELFLDSGAFSAYTQGVEIDIQEYITFVKEHEDVLTVYANLDAIGDAVKTLENQRTMEAAGLHPLPCFHIGEDLSYLDLYIAEYDYIAIGGMLAIGTGRAEVARVLDRLWAERICGADGMPKVKVHGFGLTSLRLMLRYPWYSVDSTSWVITGRMGSVYVPKPWTGALDEPWKVCVSTRSPSKSEAGQHITTISPTQREQVLAYCESKGYVLGRSSFREEKEGYVLKEGEKATGKTSKGALAEDQEVETIEEWGLCNDYRLRDELNIIYFLDLERAMPEWPWAFKLAKKRGGFGL